jgi:hypothetical protein
MRGDVVGMFLAETVIDIDRNARAASEDHEFTIETIDNRERAANELSVPHAASGLRPSPIYIPHTSSVALSRPT